MSKFLGPIHYWLYGKTGHQEALTTAVARHAQASGWIAEPSAYTKELPALEDVIDTENIHGWLQGQITDAETRYANLVSDVLMDHGDRLAEVLRVCFLFGRESALPPDADAAQAYQAFESFFVNGMPCDRINIATEQSPETVSWQMAQDIHAQY